MQTFLPYMNLKESAKCLDYKRLCKQRVEAKQIWSILSENSKSKAWVNHPTVLMWKGYEDLLALYYNTILQEYINRGYNNNMKFLCHPHKHIIQIPDWFGSKIHETHKSKLLFKGRVDSICSAIKKGLKLKSINSWLKNKGYPEKNAINYKQMLNLEIFAILHFNKLIKPNYYKQFNWKISDNLEYYWPVTKQGELYENKKTN